MSAKELIKTNVIEKYFNKLLSKEITWIGIFSILTALAAQVAVPTQPVPFTLQTMFVLLSGAFLGSRNGAYSQVLYLLVGAIGVPVFSNLSFGINVLFGPTGGYLLAFPVAAYLTGRIIEMKRNSLTVILSMVLSSLVILLVGASYLTTFYNGNFNQAFFAGAIIFSIWDIIKISAAASIYYSVSKRYPKLPK
ncbi:MAG: biotin transporter BioY [Ignavibacteriales bacterium]|nr:MAG: biotin transporter BioY [Ignavibacteriales bacterium]